MKKENLHNLVATIGFFGMVLFLGACSIGLIIAFSSEEDNNDIYNPPDSTPVYYGDMNCGDFATSWEAQQFYEEHGSSDLHDLDRDNDGKACDWGTN